MSRGKRRASARLPADLIDRIDARVVAWRAPLPGMRVTRTDMIAILLDAGLRHAEAPDVSALPTPQEPEAP